MQFGAIQIRRMQFGATLKNMKKTSVFLLLLTTFTFAFAQEGIKYKDALKSDDLAIRSKALAQKYIITDGHVDVPYRIAAQVRRGEEVHDISQRTPGGDFDFVRAREGGLDAPFMSIFIPAIYQTLGGAKKYADNLIDMVYGFEEKHPDKFVVAVSPKDVKKAFRSGKIALPMGMENGAPIEDSIENVGYFHTRGIRYITLTHSKDNQICDSSYDTTRTWNGLSPFGREVVKEMNRVGIMVDISHVSDSAFYQALEITKVPVIASHSSCRKYTPGFERNMNDDMIKRLAENGGVIQINFGSSFLHEPYRTFDNAKREAIKNYMFDNDAAWEDSSTVNFRKNYDETHKREFATVQVVADHIDHVVELAGIDHVGLGSDYDGVGDSLPVGLKDVSDYPNLLEELLRRGYSDEDIAKICYKNVFRVWKAVEDFAK